MNTQLFPALDSATEDALRESIRRFGVLVPAIVTQDGELLDGHHRRRIASEEGVACPTRRVVVPDGVDPVEMAATLNLDRRQLDREQRRQLVIHLREQGHSLRAIAGAVGISHEQARKDSGGVNDLTPETTRGRDGKHYPARRPAPTLTPGEPEAIEDTLLDANDHEPTGEELADAIDENLDSKTTPARSPTKPDLGNGVSHPARYSDQLLPVFLDLLGDRPLSILDPFAGTGKIHQLREHGHTTTGVELEPEWADLHDGTIQGDALALPFGDGTFDAIVTSPTYGNRLADHHAAADPERRRSYTHDLGRPLHANNSGAMQWGSEYRTFHQDAWVEAHRVLTDGGMFILNVKDHIRSGKWQDVAGWHVSTICALGFTVEAVRPVVTSSLRAGANSGARVDAEMIIAFTKEGA